jgi:hypothetical protein
VKCSIRALLHHWCSPETVSVALQEIAADMREGLLALAVGTGLQLMEADVAAVCGPKGKHNSTRDAVPHGGEAPAARKDRASAAP